MFRPMSRREVLACAAAGAAIAAGAEPRAASAPVTWPFYAFDNGLGTVPVLEDKVKLLKDLGYDGIAYHMNHAELPRMLDALDRHGLTLFAIYTTPFLEDALDPKFPESLGRLRGRATRIETGLRSRTHKPSDPAGDAQGLALLLRLSDLCADTGPVLSVYPHAGFWTEKVDDGVRLAKASGRKNIGTNFNLVHWLWVAQSRPLVDVLRAALPHLFLVTINGARRREILPLDDGDYDLLAFLRLVASIGYKGPVGLQCYSVPGPSEVHLRRSIARWRELMGALRPAT